jgi:hypothetical protein
VNNLKPTDGTTMRRIHQVALWAGISAFFGSLLAIGVFDVFDPDQWLQYLGAVIVAAITAAGVYANERLHDAKYERDAAESTDAQVGQK